MYCVLYIIIMLQYRYLGMDTSSTTLCVSTVSTTVREHFYYQGSQYTVHEATAETNAVSTHSMLLCFWSFSVMQFSSAF